MGSFPDMKMVLLLVFIIIPTITFDHVNAANSTTSTNYSPPSASPSEPKNQPPNSSTLVPPPPPFPTPPPYQPVNQPPPPSAEPPHSLAPPPFSSPSPSPSVPFGSSSIKMRPHKLKCPKLLKQEMVAKVLKCTNAPKAIRSILRKSEKFGICIARKFCGCFTFQSQPLINYDCFNAIGEKCIKNSISDRVHACILDCVKKSTMNSTNHYHNDDEVAIGEFCYRQYMLEECYIIN